MCKEDATDPAGHDWHQRTGNCSVCAWLDLRLAQHTASLSFSLFNPSRRMAQLIRRRPSCRRHCHYARFGLRVARDQTPAVDTYSTCFLSVFRTALRIFQVVVEQATFGGGTSSAYYQQQPIRGGPTRCVFGFMEVCKQLS